MAAILPAASALAYPADGGSSAAGAAVSWDSRTPDPGSPIKLRIRGEALAALLTPQADWQLLAGGSTLYADLHLPENSLPDETGTELPITSRSSPAAQDSWVVVDCSEFGRPVSRLRLKLSSPELKGLAQVFFSKDGIDFTVLGTAQPIYQLTDATGILQLTTLEIEATDAPMLKIEITGNGVAGAISDVLALDPLPDLPDLYEVPVALGPMQGPDETGQCIWPLVLPANGIPLVLFDVHGKAGAEPVTLSVLRIDDQLRMVRRMTSGALVEGFIIDGADLTHSQFGIPLVTSHLATVENNMYGWAVALQCPEDTVPLNLTSITARAAEVWLAFVMPDTAEIELWFNLPKVVSEHNGTDIKFPLDKFDAAGGFDKLTLLAAEPEQPVAEVPAWKSGLQRWRLPVLFGLGALSALIMGAALLRGRSR